MNKNFITLCKIFLAALLVALVACPTTSSETSKSEEGKQHIATITKNDGDTLRASKFANKGYTAIKFVETGENKHIVTEIDYGAFEGNKIAELTLPDSITKVGDDAFKGNPLTKLTLSKNLTDIGKNAFQTTAEEKFQVILKKDHESHFETTVKIASIFGKSSKVEFQVHKSVDQAVKKKVNDFIKRITPKIQQVRGKPLFLLAHALDSLSKDLNVDKDHTSSSNLKDELTQLAKELEDQKDLLVKTVPDKTQFAAGLMMLALGAAQHDKDAVAVGLGYVVAALIDDSALDQWIKGTYNDRKKDLSGTYTANPLKGLAAFKTVLESLESDTTSQNALNKAILKAAKTTLQRALARSGDTVGIMTTKDVEKTKTLALAGKVASAERTRIAKALVEVAKAALTADASPDSADLKKLAEHVSMGTVVILLKTQLETVKKDHANMPDALTKLKNTLKAPNGADKDGALVTALSTALKTVVPGRDLQTAMTLALVALKVTDADTTKLEGLMVAAEAAGKEVDEKSPKKKDVLDAMTKVSAVLEELATLLSTALPKVPSVTL